ncbi:unnamed protein product [Amoebophrya sp. A25]|nr:unnamed protein product [Amoebophrya sp. A25]|eukprot:GSA25T00017422001.1
MERKTPPPISLACMSLLSPKHPSSSRQQSVAAQLHLGQKVFKLFKRTALRRPNVAFTKSAWR